jgi:hypothetical protein
MWWQHFPGHHASGERASSTRTFFASNARRVVLDSATASIHRALLMHERGYAGCKSDPSDLTEKT